MTSEQLLADLTEVGDNNIKHLTRGLGIPATPEDFDKLPEDDKRRLRAALELHDEWVEQEIESIRRRRNSFP